MSAENGGTLAYRLSQIEQAARDLDRQLERTHEMAARHEEQINGVRGLSKAIDGLSEEVKSLRRAMWTVGGMIVASAVGFAFTVLTVFG